MDITMVNISNKKTDRTGYDEEYKGNISEFSCLTSIPEYIEAYQSSSIGPYYKSKNTKGYVRGEAINRLILFADSKNILRKDILILDAGSGQGELSVYLACLGFNVIGVDISSEAKLCGEHLSKSIGLGDNCNFHAESLESISIDDSSVDFVIGHASLHHFIKYGGVPSEFKRILRPGGKGFFADSFGENKLYHVFHNKEKMERLGDVTLTKELIESYFSGFEVRITPTDWLVMLDKLYKKLLPKPFSPLINGLSYFHNSIDRKIPVSSRIALFLSGSVLTEITKT